MVCQEVLLFIAFPAFNCAAHHPNGNGLSPTMSIMAMSKHVASKFPCFGEWGIALAPFKSILGLSISLFPAEVMKTNMHPSLEQRRLNGPLTFKPSCF